jgi:alkylhydroperoxidase family enzyme
MAWIKTIAPEKATGLLARLYEGATQRAGKLFHIIRIQSLRPDVLNTSTRLYMQLMHEPRGALRRDQREMIATVVSQVNACHY